MGPDRGGLRPPLRATMTPLLPRKSPPFKVHWNWELLLACNYRCSYCGAHKEGVPCLELDIAQWRAIWGRIFDRYGCCQVRFAGGEPTIYPGFIPLVSMLLERHTVDITTNLSFDIAEWVAKVPAQGIAISGSLHPEFMAPEEFLRRLLMLREHGGRLISACIVAYPPHLGQLESTRLLFERNQILFKIIPFSGVYQGRRYPEAYTEQEKALLQAQVDGSSDPLGKTLNRQWQDYAKAPAEDKDRKDLKGRLCHMGELYAKILPDGKVLRCCHPEVAALGHITDADLKLYEEPQPCTVEVCPCWKAMVAGQYEAKVDQLWQSPEHPRYPLAQPT